MNIRRRREIRHGGWVNGQGAMKGRLRTGRAAWAEIAALHCFHAVPLNELTLGGRVTLARGNDVCSCLFARHVRRGVVGLQTRVSTVCDIRSEHRDELQQWVIVAPNDLLMNTH